jgi:hypothetical protein
MTEKRVTMKKITLDMVDVLAPEHYRTSCSDDDIVNGFNSSEYGARCTRCALLEVVHDQDGEIPQEFVWCPGHLIRVNT